MYPPGIPTRDYDIYEEFAETCIRRELPIDPTTGERYALDGLFDAIAFVRAVMRKDDWLHGGSSRPTL
jgi:hypothetical protein